MTDPETGEVLPAGKKDPPAAVSLTLKCKKDFLKLPCAFLCSAELKSFLEASTAEVVPESCKSQKRPPTNVHTSFQALASLQKP
jgi:hypothetical protein